MDNRQAPRLEPSKSSKKIYRKPEIIDYVETYVFNSDKCMAVFRP